VKSREIILPRTGAPAIKIPLDADGNFDLADFGGDNLPPGVPRKAKPFKVERIWHMGIVLAAQELGLDLSKAEVDLPEGRIVLRGTNGVKRVIPVDQDGYFYIDWCLRPSDPHLEKEAIQNLLVEDKLRLLGTNGLPDPWAGKLIVVGSSATGNNLTDRGATPLDRDTLLVSEHWNVANSILTNRFVRRSSLATDLLIIAAMAILAALLTWQLRALLASFLVLLSAAVYILLGVFLYVEDLYWLPLVLPVFGALLMTHVCLVTWRVVFEQAEKRRVKSVFSKIVSPDIVNELLKAEKFTLGGTRREITVLFADVRGFTALTDESHEKATEFVRERKLDGAAAEAYFDEQARETLNTVNAYLALVADTVKKHAGTLDKYIGDCVMAFWGAPTPNLKHALVCVRAAIDAQRAVRELNVQRSNENRKRELENLARISSGLTPRPLLPILMLGTGINTGLATVGLMGSEAHISNYTVFGREVNLASRLESLSGRGRIIVSELTYAHVLRDDPTVAATCQALAPVNVKGIRTAVKVYEIPWRPADAIPFDEEFSAGGHTDAAALTGFIQRSST
ncbi:MAG TPA: adenylate/guanylate cyclase domain-containing protein, partial [Verrucomicrobiae bacterium]|nr:adenylate/guanylate cyclase domain-containing protein [Verrucomicrobiae bacterium]